MRVKLAVCVDIHRNYAVMVSMHSRCGRILDLVDIEQYRTSLVDFGSQDSLPRLTSTHLYQKQTFGGETRAC